MKRSLCKICLLVLFISCKKDPVSSGSQSDSFSTAFDRGVIENIQISEASGIVTSGLSSNVFWTHNDSGDTNRIFAIDSLGKGTRSVTVEGGVNRDWEAIAMTTFPEGTFLYIGDIGDNDNTHGDYCIYRIAEPADGVASTDRAQKIIFQYPDGPRDAECLLIDHQSKDIYILSKRENKKRLYRLAFPQVYDRLLTAEFIAEMPFSPGTDVGSYITDGNVSLDNSQIIIKSYLHIYHWRLKGNETIAQALVRPASILPYSLEAQGEALTFTKNASAYLTLSEESDKKLPVHLYAYQRK